MGNSVWLKKNQCSPLILSSENHFFVVFSMWKSLSGFCQSISREHVIIVWHRPYTVNILFIYIYELHNLLFQPAAYHEINEVIQILVLLLSINRRNLSDWSSFDKLPEKLTRTDSFASFDVFFSFSFFVGENYQ